MTLYDITEWEHVVTYLEEHAGKELARQDCATLAMQFPEHSEELGERIDALSIVLVGPRGE